MEYYQKLYYNGFLEDKEIKIAYLSIVGNYYSEK